MLHPIAPLLIRPGRSAACLIAGGALLWLMGGPGEPGASAVPDPAARHGIARAAFDHLSGLRSLTEKITEAAAADRRIVLEADLKRARTALGADMIALREAVAPGEEEIALRDTLAALAPYQAAWTDARSRMRSGDPDGAHRALTRAAPLGDRAAGALAALGHAMDDGNVAAERMVSAAERRHRLRNAGLALLAAGILLLWAGRPQHAELEMKRA
ncbi:MAG TPA: hypothetical protein VKQ29_09735 [Aliidongia sp.]|nr:hypothetical protein [Aliidongia sp.]